MEDSFLDIRHMMSLGYHSQLCSSRSIEFFFQPTLYDTNKSLIFDKTKEGRWIGMIFIPQLHNIYCLSFYLKQEGMNYIDDNLKMSRIIWVTNIMVEKIGNILVCPKKFLIKYKDWL